MRRGTVVALSGGVGGAKLALGLSGVLPPDELLVIANTGDDFEHLGLSISPDIDTLTYVLAAVGAELPGTYTAAVFAKTKDDLDQLYIGAELQLGTATREEFATGPAPSEKCAGCHKSPMSGKFYLHHSHPGRSAYGSFNYDSEPIETCLACHNGDGYSRNLIIAKAHSIHRGKNLTNQIGRAHV